MSRVAGSFRDVRRETDSLGEVDVPAKKLWRYDLHRHEWWLVYENDLGPQTAELAQQVKPEPAGDWVPLK